MSEENGLEESNKLIGTMPCGNCGEEVEVKESKGKGKFPYYSCIFCSTQMFGRSRAADLKIREQIAKHNKPAEPSEEGGKDEPSIYD